MVALTEVTTTELIARCRRGGARPGTLVDRYARLVHAVALRHGLRGGEVEDVAQEVFLALKRTLAEIDDPERLPGWLATTTGAPAWRAVQMRRREEELDDPELAAEHASTAQTTAAQTPATPMHAAPMPSIGELLDLWQRQGALTQAMTRLQARCRTLLTMLFLDEQEPSYDDIAANLDIPKGSIGPTRTRCSSATAGDSEPASALTVSRSCNRVENSCIFLPRARLFFAREPFHPKDE
ncbi:MAG: sigma-70 family RNA polymerase sigma factor [Caldilineaceae bacterium]